MFGFLKKALKNVYSRVTTQLWGIFSRGSLSQDDLTELRTILLNADTGVKTTNALMDNLNERYRRGEIKEGMDLHDALRDELIKIVSTKNFEDHGPVYMLVGINGSGKTTFAAKLAHHYTQQGKKVLLAAADTFRAAAVEQLQVWGERVGVTVVAGEPNADPASVVYKACEAYVKDGYDILIIDTAGRLQTKTNLMRELEKVGKVLHKHVVPEDVTTLLTVDAMLGQNSFDQARQFNEAVAIDGIVLTKMDGTGKGGIVFAIVSELGIPVGYISFGEQIDQMRSFDSIDYITELLSK